MLHGCIESGRAFGGGCLSGGSQQFHETRGPPAAGAGGASALTSYGRRLRQHFSNMTLSKEIHLLANEVYDNEVELWDLRHRVALLQRENERLRAELRNKEKTNG